MRPVAPDVSGAKTTRQIRARLFAIAWPAMLENVIQGAIFMANTALAGRLGLAGRRTECRRNRFPTET